MPIGSFWLSFVFLLCLRSSFAEFRVHYGKLGLGGVDQQNTGIKDGALGSSMAMTIPKESGFDFNKEEIEKLKLWEGGNIPYYIDNFSFGKPIREKLRSLLNMVNTLGNVHFRELYMPPDNASTRWVFFINRRAHQKCVDHDLRNFTTEGVQKVVLGYDCSSYGDLANIILNVLGVPPMHNAPNRDKFITVNEDNILDDKKYLFEKFGDTSWLFHDLDYDFASASHFDFHKHTKNGRATIEPKNVAKVEQDTSGVTVGEAGFFSYTDLLKIQMLYNYISSKSESYNTSKCSKLFLNCNNPSISVPPEGEIKPRIKPMQYAGEVESVKFVGKKVTANKLKDMSDDFTDESSM